MAQLEYTVNNEPTIELTKEDCKVIIKALENQFVDRNHHPEYYDIFKLISSVADCESND